MINLANSMSFDVVLKNTDYKKGGWIKQVKLSQWY